MSLQILIESDEQSFTVSGAEFELGAAAECLIVVFDEDDIDGELRAFGPYLSATAVHWARRARVSNDPIATLVEFDKEFTRRMAGNDWSGLIPGLVAS